MANWRVSNNLTKEVLDDEINICQIRPDTGYLVPGDLERWL
jgi:hypothetical protein